MANEHTQVLQIGSNGIKLVFIHGNVVDAVTRGPITSTSTPPKENGCA